MKLQVLLVYLFLFSISVLAQDFRGENKVFIKLESVSDGTLDYESNKFTVQWNEEQNQFNFFVDLQSFLPLDNSTTLTLFKELFEEEYQSGISYKSDFDVSKFDAQSDRAQQVELNGELWLGTQKTVQPLRLELRQMDRLLFFDFELVTQLSKLNVDIPEKYKNKLTGKVFIQVLSGKLSAGFK